MKNTLIVNLYAGPGAGKSTGAAYIFAKLKWQVLIVNMSKEELSKEITELNV